MEKVENKITEEQLTKIKSQQEEISNTLSEVGYIEANKHGLLHKLAGLNEQVEATKKELEDQYGAVNINLEDGSYTPIEPKAEPVNA